VTPVVVACRDCHHWRRLTLQLSAGAEPRGECKAIPGGWIVTADDFCAMWKAKDVMGTCEECGQEFPVGPHHRQTCSDKCRVRRHRRLETPLPPKEESPPCSY
jgi:hypothetical protein